MITKIVAANIHPSILRLVFTRTIQLVVLIALCCVSTSAHASSARIKKVLPQLVDAKGRNSLSPSLYSRDAYQFLLRNEPDKRGGIRFYIKWNSGSASAELRLKVEARGATGETVRTALMELPVKKTGWFSRWTSLELRDRDYKDFGDLVAWRVSLWEGNQQLAEQKSFLW